MTTREHLRAAAGNLEMLAEEIESLAAGTDHELLSLHDFADELEATIGDLGDFAGRGEW